MSYQTRTPSTKLTLDRNLYNELLGILDINIEMKIEDENFSTIAEKLKNKIMQYSVPRINEEGIEYVDVRFFPSEASDMIWQLLIRSEKNDSVKDYYSELLSSHLKNKESQM